MLPLLLASALVPGALALDPDAAHMLDLDLRLQGAEPVALTLSDVQPGPQPGIVVEAGEGHRYRVYVDLSDAEPTAEGDETVQIDLRVEEDTEIRRGRWESSTLCRPRLLTRVDQEARITIGFDVPFGADPVEHPPQVDLGVVVRTAE